MKHIKSLNEFQDENFEPVSEQQQYGDPDARLTIIVTQRTEDYHASIKGREGAWGCGKDMDAAIGSLVRSHPDTFDTKFEFHF